MTPAAWEQALARLISRLPQYGVTADLSAMTSAELWGLYRFLTRLAEAQ